MIGNFGENSLLVKTYKYLVNNSIMLGSSMLKPIYTKKSSQSLDNAYLINLSKTISTESILFTLKNTDAYKQIKFKTFTFATDGNKTVTFHIYLNGATLGTFNSWGSGSIAEVSTDGALSLTTTSISGVTKIDEEIGGTILAKVANSRIDLSDGDVDISIGLNDTITVTAESSGNNEVTVLARWIEEI